LAEAGGSLKDLAGRLEQLDRAASGALAALVPACLCQAAHGRPAPRCVTFLERAEAEQPVSSADRVGRFLPCRCGPERARHCPGVAAGWSLQS
jgi:hypothetical protein